MNGENKTFEEHLEHVHPRLKTRFFLYALLFVIMVCVVVFRVISDAVSPLFPVIGFVVGAIIGIFVSRASHISWDKNAQKVISRLDIYGILILAAYVIFEFFRLQVIGYFIHGPVVLATSFAVLAGIMIGRVLGIRGKILSVLEENL